MRSREGNQCVNLNCPASLRDRCGRYLNKKLATKQSYVPVAKGGSYGCDAFDMRESMK